MQTSVRQRWGVVTAMILLAAACSAKKSPSGAPSRAGADNALQIEAQRAQRRDVPLVRTGLGSAQALYTTLVRSQVDGPLIEVGFVEGQEVKRGDVLARVDPRPFRIAVNEAKAALIRDRAQLDNTRLNQKRSQKLLDDKLVSTQTVTDLAASVAQLEGTVLADEAAVASAELQLERASIVAPISGRTGVRQLDPGNLVHAGDLNGIVLITALDPIAVLFTLPEDDLALVAAAQARGEVPVDILGRTGSDVLGRGKLLLIDNQINLASGSVRLKALVDNPNHTLWPNQFVRARMQLDMHKGALTVPAHAIVRGPRGDAVWVVDANNTANTHKVSVGQLDDDDALIDSGLSEGDQVVVEGQFRLHAGSQVRVLTPERAATQDEAVERPLGAPAP